LEQDHDLGSSSGGGGFSFISSIPVFLNICEANQKDIPFYTFMLNSLFTNKAPKNTLFFTF
ncbi:hypothetical protein AACA72_00105, partial [Enterococcus faecium]|uniref:hypothetical protein n=1 Tax=Enterococcus faecium TaxID=1352 RepID=UPI00317CE579